MFKQHVIFVLLAILFLSQLITMTLQPIDAIKSRGTPIKQTTSPAICGLGYCNEVSSYYVQDYVNFISDRKLILGHIIAQGYDMNMVEVLPFNPSAPRDIIINIEGNTLPQLPNMKIVGMVQQSASADCLSNSNPELTKTDIIDDANHNNKLNSLEHYDAMIRTEELPETDSVKSPIVSPGPDGNQIINPIKPLTNTNDLPTSRANSGNVIQQGIPSMYKDSLKKDHMKEFIDVDKSSSQTKSSSESILSTKEPIGIKSDLSGLHSDIKISMKINQKLKQDIKSPCNGFLLSDSGSTAPAPIPQPYPNAGTTVGGLTGPTFSK